MVGGGKHIRAEQAGIVEPAKGWTHNARGPSWAPFLFFLTLLLFTCYKATLFI
jgi:hypothetical protein